MKYFLIIIIVISFIAISEDAVKRQNKKVGISKCDAFTHAYPGKTYCKE